MQEATEYLNETAKAVAIKKLPVSFIALYMVLFHPDNIPMREAEEVVLPSLFFNRHSHTDLQGHRGFQAFPGSCVRVGIENQVL